MEESPSLGEEFFKPTIYVLTYYDFNHGPLRPGREAYPLDDRFLNSSQNYVYYLIDEKIPEPLKQKQTILECKLDPILHRAGGDHLGEWSFLLAEEKHRFCTYPLFMISSRFYEKNSWLYKDLNQEWDRLFSYFQHNSWGYLPSYNRPIRWIPLAWENRIKREIWKTQFYPYTEGTFRLIEELFQVKIPEQYPATADLFCNYIGFKDRQALLDYIGFYRPFFDFFFDANYKLKRDLAPYARTLNAFPRERPLTFFLELISHLFFFSKKQSYFALHYDGYYQVDERDQTYQKVEKFSLPLSLSLERNLRWTWHRWNSEGRLGQWRIKLGQIF